jgi:hypothetical protein
VKRRAECSTARGSLERRWLTRRRSGLAVLAAEYRQALDIGSGTPLFRRGPNNFRRYPLMIRKLADGRYRLYSRKVNPSTRRRRNLGTFSSLAAAKKHERAVQYFKRH